MKTNYVTTGEKYPEIFVTKNKQRLKQHGSSVYLNNGEEFELEFFNPTSKKILAKIKFNGVSIGSGLIIRPGERVFLERYFDTSKKFLFEIYEVNGINKQVLTAIEQNGNISVDFYKEYEPITYSTNTILINNVNSSPSIWYAGTSNTNLINTGTSTSQIGNNTYTLLDGTVTCGSYTTTSISSTPMETGRIEKGSQSNQTFSYDYTTFEYFPFHKTNWKILPNSVKQITKDDLVVYCGVCGSKRKKDTYKFCPHCGEKY